MQAILPVSDNLIDDSTTGDKPSSSGDIGNVSVQNYGSEDPSRNRDTYSTLGNSL